MPVPAHPEFFLVATLSGFATILMIFGMKYFSAGRQVRLRLAAEGAYKDLAERAASAQAASAAVLAALQTDLAETKTRLGAVETMLREVG